MGSPGTASARAPETAKIAYRRSGLYPKQGAAIFDPHRFSLIEASTKSGKTHGCGVWLLERALLRGREGRAFWWIAPVYGQAKIAYSRMKRAVRPLGPGVKTNEGDLRITLPNRADVWFKSGEKPDNLYGEDVWDFVIDEASRLRQESFHAIRSTITYTRGHGRMIGNVKGRRNWFYHLCRAAEAGDDPESAYHKLTWEDAVRAGVLDVEEIIGAHRQLPEAVFRELYEAIPSDDEGNPFGFDHIRRCAEAFDERWGSGLSALDPVAWGWDLAKSVDWTVGVGLDAIGDLAAFRRYRKPWRETIEDIKESIGSDPALVDSTGVGDPIVETLQREGAPVEGYHFSLPSKQRLMEGLSVAIQRGEIGFPVEGVLRSELDAFEFQYTRTGVRYSAPEGYNDDSVMALALAVMYAAHGQTPASPEAIRVDRSQGPLGEVLG